MTNQSTIQLFRSDKKYIIILSVFTFLLLFFCSKMSPFYVTNEWSDPNIYFNVAKGMLNGRTLYTEVFDHKGPFIFFLYGGGYLISNDTFFGVFIIEAIAWLLLAYSIYFTSRLFCGKNASLFVAMAFPLFLLKLMKAGGSAEEFILVCEAISLYLFVKYFSNEKASTHPVLYMLVHGVLCSVVFFTKINLIMFWFFPLLGILINILIHKQYKNFVLNALAYIGGFLVIALPILYYLYANEALDEAYFAYIELNTKYSQMSSFFGTILLLIQRLMFLFMDPISLVVIPFFGIFYFPIRHIKHKIGRWSLILCGISLYVVIFMAPAFQYYYPVAYIVVDILGLLGMCLFLKRYLKFNYSTKLLAFTTVVLFFIGLSQKPMTNTRIESAILGKQAISSRFQTQKLHNEIMKEKNPTLLNIGFGLGTSLYTTCNIVPNVRFFLKPNITNDIYPDIRIAQTKYIENREIQFIIMPQYLYPRSVRMAADDAFDKQYYENLPAMKEHYTLVLRDTIINRIDENALEIYHLYKRND